MFLLGHSCWSYLVSKSAGRALHVKIPLSLALLTGLLPDFDIYFQPIIPHHTITHSLLLLGPITALLSYRYKRLGAAFSMGILSHLLTDSLVGSIPIFYPLSTASIGLGLGIPSPADTLLEVGALAASIGLAILNGDYILFTKPRKESVRMAIPLAAIVTLTLLYAVDIKIPLTALAFSRKAFTAITLGHIVLITALGAGTFQGARAYIRETPHEQNHDTNSAAPTRSDRKRKDHLSTTLPSRQWSQRDPSTRFVQSSLYPHPSDQQANPQQ